MTEHKMYFCQLYVTFGYFDVSITLHQIAVDISAQSLSVMTFCVSSFLILQPTLELFFF